MLLAFLGITSAVNYENAEHKKVFKKTINDDSRPKLKANLF